MIFHFTDGWYVLLKLKLASQPKCQPRPYVFPQEIPNGYQIDDDVRTANSGWWFEPSRP